MTPEEITRATRSVLDAPYRARQLYDAVHVRTVTEFAQVKELSLTTRAQLDQHFTLDRPRLEAQVPSADGTCKALFALQDGATIEAVDIPDRDRRTFCVSSQAGCALACRFCVTGYWGAGRNLTVDEIVGQIYALREKADLPWSVINLVFMGMGEPLLNTETVRRSLQILSEKIPWTRSTVSTAGVVPGILEMASWPQRPNLAISLHAPTDQVRDQIMPINRKYPLDSLFAALREYPVTRSRRLTFEYILIEGLNDSEATARLLTARLHGFRCRVNLIPFNPDPVLGDLRPPSDEVVDRFRRQLVAAGIRCVVRRPRGDDVAAACGQLRAYGREPRGFAALELNPAASDAFAP